MKGVYFSILLLILFLGSSIASHSQGLKLLSVAELAEQPEMENEVAGYATNFPSKHNMLQFAPPALIQEGGTCVGFAAAYCAQSIMINKATNTTHPNHKWIVSMDPYFVYSLLNSGSSDPCDEGLQFPALFDAMEKFGNMRDLMPPTLSCDFNWLNQQGEIRVDFLPYTDATWPFRIEEYGWLDLERSDWVRGIKTYVSNDVPVVIGASVNDDFSPAAYGGQIDADGLWNYRASNNGEAGGHAMCVLGYDDTKGGGSFLVRNSWGSDFGIRGNVWIKYKDFRSIVSEAWVIIPENWTENIYSADDYSFEFKSTGVDGLHYGRVEGDGVIYEGFYEEGVQVLGFELYADGGVYFGQFIDLVKHGRGIYWDPDYTRYTISARNGEVLDIEAGFGLVEEIIQNPDQIEYIDAKLKINEDWEYFEGELPQGGYELPNK